MYKKVVKFSFTQQKIFWVLVFSFMYLVSVDPMDRSLVTEFLNLSDEFDTGQEILTNRNHQILILCLGTANITSTER